MITGDGDHPDSRRELISRAERVALALYDEQWHARDQPEFVSPRGVGLPRRVQGKGQADNG